MKWITPGFTDPLGFVRSLATLVANRHADGHVPYALRAANATFARSSGEIRLNESIGFTCSTFVLRLFSSTGITLIDEPTWETGRSEARIEEDTAAQKKLVEFLRDRDPAHAAAVEREIGCTRIRAEEVAAASASTKPPVTFSDVVEVGARLLASLE